MPVRPIKAQISRRMASSNLAVARRSSVGIPDSSCSVYSPYCLEYRRSQTDSEIFAEHRCPKKPGGASAAIDANLVRSDLIGDSQPCPNCATISSGTFVIRIRSSTYRRTHWNLLELVGSNNSDDWASAQSLFRRTMLFVPKYRLVRRRMRSEGIRIHGTRTGDAPPLIISNPISS